MAEYSLNDVFGSQQASVEPPPTASAPEQEAPKSYSLDDVYKQQPAATDEKPLPGGILEAGYEGLKQSLKELGQSASAVSGSSAAYSPPPEQSPYEQGFGWSDLTHPFAQGLPKVAYRVAKGAPGLAGGIAGTIAGAATPIPGGALAGGALGMGAVEAFQTVGPAFQQELQKTPDDPNGAWDRAVEHATASGAAGGASWALFPARVFSKPMKDLAFQVFGAQPATSMAEQAAHNVINNEDATKGLGQAYVEGATSRAMLPFVGHKAANVAIGDEALHEHLANAFDPLRDVALDLQKKATPMAAADASDYSRAAAKDFANGKRLARDRWVRDDDAIQQNFSPDRRQAMWDAANDQSERMQQGETPEQIAQQGAGISQLAPPEQAAVQDLQGKATNVFEQAKAVGIVDKNAEGLPSYVPRMVAQLGLDGEDRPLSQGAPGGVRTTTPQMLERKYLMAGETEAAAKAKLGDQAQLVRDIRTLPMATARLQEAVYGRTLINKIDEFGKQTGQKLVLEGDEQGDPGAKYFTIPNPAFAKFVPRFMQNDLGKTVPVRDQHGNIVFDKVPLQVHSYFEGPLKAVMSQGPDGAIYKGLMDLKAKSMGAIMYSPAIHNMVEFGRAFPTMPGKMITGRVYLDGSRAKADPQLRDEAITNGLVPIGKRGAMQDITGMVEEPNIQPGRSWTAQVLGAIPNFFDPRAGDTVKRAIDKMGDIWHNKLLWNIVENLQFGLYKNFADKFASQGFDPVTSGRMAAHLANRYAGAIPNEAMSQSARKLANLMMFSRSFTLGNIGAMKDALTGLPRDVQAQILRDAGPQMLSKAVSTARRKAISILMLDMGMFYAANSLLQSGASYIRGDQTLNQIEQGYVNRFQQLLARTKEHPFDVLMHPFGAAESLTEQANNEPGKRDRILVGYQKDGTAIYMRNPFGKIGEEFVGYLTGPFDMVKRKLGTMARPIMQTFQNDKGFGRKVYNPYAENTPEQLQNVGNIVQQFMQAQFPTDAISTARDVVEGPQNQQTLNALKVLGPLGGLTFSKGAPGGPAMGEMFRANEMQRIRQQEAMPDIRKDISNGNIPRAITRMNQLRIDPRLQRYYIVSTLNPGIRISQKTLQNFYRQADPEAIQRFEADLAARRGQP